MNEICGFETDKELAQLFGLKQQNFSNRKTKGTLTNEIILKCSELHPEVNLHWLITGHGPKYIMICPENQWHVQAINEIFQSGETATIEALKANISQFYEKVGDKKRMGEMEKNIKDLEKDVKRLKNSISLSKKPADKVGGE